MRAPTSREVSVPECSSSPDLRTTMVSAVMRPIRLLLPVLALLVLGLPSTASAAAPGVNLVSTKCPPKDGAGNVLDSNVQTCDVQEAHSLGAKSIRLFLRWAQAEGSPGTLDTGYLEKFRDRVAEAKALGMTTYIPILTAPQWSHGSADVNTPPNDPQAYGSFAGRVADIVGGGGSVVYEVWNEQDEAHFWKPAPDVAKYVAMLRSAHGAIKAKNPDATVLFGALTGGNYEYMAAAYANGAKGSFDGVAVHTDTACLVQPPDFYVRNIGQGLDGRINRFSFLSYREVRQVMEANGDARPIHMTELGWSTFEQKCDQPGFQNQPDRLGGVSVAQQAANLTKAYQCIANDPYVVAGLWFSLRDFDASNKSTSKYGLMGRPAEQSFREVAAAGGGGAAKCGDFEGPQITSLVPASFGSILSLRAKAVDETGLANIAFAVDGKPVDTFVQSQVANDKVVGLDFRGAAALADGPHKVTISSMDLRGNRSSIDVTTVKGGAAGQVVGTTGKLAIKVGKGRVARFSGKLSKTFAEAMDGKARIEWQAKRKGKWKKIHGGDKRLKMTAAQKTRAFTFKQKLRFKGQWRVRFTYTPKPPFKAFTTKWVAFRAR
jgi:hypothetical protein